MNDSALVWNPNAATRRRYTTNATNQYADDGQYPLTYDQRGNLTNDGLYALGYNAKNQLVSAAGQSTTATYAYDALGRREAKTVNSSTTSFLYDGAVEIATYDNGGALKERVIPGHGLDNVLVVIAGSSKFYQHTDVLGSVMMVTDQAGVIVKKFSYGPYGETDAQATSPFRHAGRRFDAEIGIYFNRARHYSPRLGRFLQPDPIQVAGGINIYTYAANDPVAFVDPSGLACADASGGGFSWLQSPGCGLGAFIGTGVFRSGLQMYFLDDPYYAAERMGAGPELLRLISEQVAHDRSFVQSPYDPNNPGYHEYSTGPFALCTRADGCTSEYLASKLPSSMVPFRSDPVPNGDESSIPGVGRVQTFYSRDGLTGTNQTLPGHIVANGTVTRSIFESEGTFYIKTTGVGENIYPGVNYVNEFLGPFVFTPMDIQLRMEIQIELIIGPGM